MVDKRERLQALLADFGRTVTGFSGGIDSTLLAVTAARVLGEGALAVTARSESLPEAELEEAVSLAGRFGLRHRVVETRELADPRYAANTPQRCFFCKEELLSHLARIAAQEGGATILLGNIADDAGDFRPGLIAARKAGARSPLMDLGFTKEDVRAWARELDLPNWDKPASACLSSRIPYGETVTAGKLRRIEQAEAFLHGMGFRGVRVRAHDRLARIETPLDSLGSVLEQRSAIEARLRELGFLYVTLDLGGYRRGSLNLPIR